jgi:hypothetical protein
MRRTVALPTALAALMLMVSVGTAEAKPGPPTQVDLFGCEAFQDGNTTINHKKDVYIKYGWATNTWKQLRQFLNVATMVVRVDGVLIGQQRARWGLPSYDEQNAYWVSWWSKRIPRFAKGESRTVTVQLYLAKPSFDGIETFPAGKFYKPRLACTVTAE